MRIVGRWWALVLAVGVTGANGVEVPVIENAGYSLCAHEANDALTVARMVIVSREGRAQIEANPALPPYMRSLANDFFSAQEAGKVPTYVHFAQDRFKACLHDQQVKLEVNDAHMLACLSRLDIPFYFFLMRRAGESTPSATARIERELAGWRYPPGLVAMLAEPAMAAQGISEVAELQRFLLSSCLLPAEDVRRHYGLPPLGGGAAASGKGR